MKNLLAILTAFIFVTGCANEETSAVEEKPTAIDTTIHPTGVNAGSVISTDTAAMNIENTNPHGRENLKENN